jgi:hypothetical protein
MQQFFLKSVAFVSSFVMGFQALPPQPLTAPNEYQKVFVAAVLTATVQLFFKVVEIWLQRKARKKAQRKTL